MYAIGRGRYKIFRETERRGGGDETVILVIEFRLKLARSSTLLHWIFQRVCIITTPFWSGMPGFAIKLWLVDPVHKNYMGIYAWQGREEARQYLHFLLPILRFFSVKNSVWGKQIYGIDLQDYLVARQLYKVDQGTRAVANEVIRR